MLILLTECRHALRDIFARPAFSALVTTVLAAGLACVVFMLAMLDGFMLRPLPFAAPDELYQAGMLGDWGLGDVFPVTDQDVIGIRRSLADVADVAAAARSTMNLGDLDRPQRVNGARVSANLFRTLGVAPLLGREFSANDETPGAPATAMLSHELWQRRYGADPDIVGRTIRLDAHQAVVAGVMPKDFSYPRREVIWQPATLAPSAARDEYSYWVVLRRHAGVDPERVRAAFETWFADAARAEPKRFRGLHPQMEPLAAMVMDRTTRAMLGSMLAAVFMVLLIACANAANLLSTRTLARRGELALRVALGASRARLVMQVFAQSLLLSLAALALALAAAHAALAWQEASMHDSEFTLLWLHFGIGGRVLAMAVAATLLTALASCVVPALQASRTALAPTLAEGGARSAGDVGFARISRVLVVGEVALSCALVICVGTLARGIAALERADIGIDTTHLLTARVLLPASTYRSAADQARLYERLGDRLRRDPEVLDASVGTALPGSYYNEMREILPDAATPGDSALPQTAYAAVDDHFPAAWGVALRDGRFFDSRDGTDGARVAVVDRRFAERYGDGAGVIGKRFRIDPRDPAGATVTIVGMIDPVVLDAPGGVPPPALLVPLRQAPFKIASIGVRTRGDALAYAPRLSAAMKDIDADTPLYWIRDYAAMSQAMSFGERTIARSFAAFGAIALLLAAAGLYGVMAFAVGRRTREIGVRRALGASRHRVLRSLFARTFAQLALGLMLGMAAGVPFAHMLSASLRTIEPGGAPAVLVALLVLGAAAALAALVPARRALRVDRPWRCATNDHDDRDDPERTATGTKTREIRTPAMFARASPFRFSGGRMTRFDCRTALRRLLRTPAFSATAVLLLGLSFGALACVFSVVYGLLYKPLPYAHSEQLVTVESRILGLPFDVGLSTPLREEIAQSARTIEGIAAYRSGEMVVRDESGRRTASMKTALVEPKVFALLGARPAVGRLFADEDIGEGAARSVVLSWDEWHQRFGGATDAVGRTLRLDDKDFRVIGVMPRRFIFPGSSTRLWLPLSFTAEQRARTSAGSFDDTLALARMRNGVSAQMAGDEFNNLAKAMPELDDAFGDSLELVAKPLRAIWIGDRREALLLMLLAVSMVWLVTTANVANLFLARALERRQEGAVTAALGATPWQRARMTIAESAVLCAAGALLGCTLLPAGLALLRQFDLLPTGTPQAIGIDAPTLLLVAALAAALCAVLASAGASVQRGNIADMIRGGGSRQTAGSAAQAMRKALVIVQVALTVALLFGIGILLRSSHNLLAEDVGFRRDHLLYASVDDLVPAKATPELRAARLGEFADRVRALPGVAAAGLGSMVPFGNSISTANYTAPGQDEARDKPVGYDQKVDAGYFAALGVPILRGRDFDANDVRNAAPVAIVDQMFVKRHFGETDPLGRHFRIGVGPARPDRELTIIGVVPTLKLRTLDEVADRPSIYQPMSAPPYAALAVRTTTDPAVLIESLKAVGALIAPNEAIGPIVTLDERIAETLRDRDRLNTLLGLLGLAALVLAGIGLYAVLACVVRQRVPEFGVRMALGARAVDVLRQVLGQGFVLIGLGLALGVPLAWAFARLLSARLYHIETLDLPTLGAVTVVLAAIGLAACLWPARRAAATDPAVALRGE